MKSTFVYMCLSKLTVTRVGRAMEIRVKATGKGPLGHCTGSGGGPQ